MPELPKDKDQLAKLLGGAGLHYDEPEPQPPPMLAANPPPAPEPKPTAWLPPDVAARVAQQNAVADTATPTTQAPPQVAPPAQQVFAKPAPAPSGFGIPQPNGGGAPAMRPVDSAYLKTLPAQLGAMDEQGRAQQQMADNEGVAQGLKGQALDQDRQAMTSAAQQRDQQAQHALAEVDAASKDAANSKEDPDQWWHSQSIVDKARLTLANGLSEFGTGLVGGKNSVMEMINKHVDDNIASQRKAIEAKRGRVADLKGSLAEMYRRFGNMEQAEAGARILHLQQLDAEAAQYGASARSDAVRANVDLAHRQFQSEIAKQVAQLTPRGGAGTDPRAAILKRAQEIADKSGGTISVDNAMGRASDEYRAAMGGQPTGNATTYAAPGKDGGAPPVEDAPALSFGQAVASYIPGTDAYLKKQEQDRHNVGVLGQIHKSTGLRGDSLEHAGDAYAVGPWTSKRAAEAKNQAAHKFGKSSGRPDEPLPADFEEDDR